MLVFIIPNSRLFRDHTLLDGSITSLNLVFPLLKITIKAKKKKIITN